MRGAFTLIATLVLATVSCKKETITITSTPADRNKKILLKDITIPHLPSPYYHFEYNADSTVAQASFDSGLTTYDIFYSGNRISEMRNNIIVNHDTLRYVYDNSGRIELINFINESNVLYRHAYFAYEGQLVKKVEWDHLVDTGFVVDRTLTFAYFPDGNVNQVTEHRPAIGGGSEINVVTHYDNYDDKTNVDDFMLLHDGIHDHLFLLQSFRLQKNNPRKETLSAQDGVAYTVDYNYTYNNNGTPALKSGNLLFTRGQQAGQRFHVSTSYSYY